MKKNITSLIILTIFSLTSVSSFANDTKNESDYKYDTEKVLNLNDSKNYLGKKKYQEYKDFYYKYVDKDLYFNSEGVKDFEYICDKPINTIDCRYSGVNSMHGYEAYTIKLGSFYYTLGNPPMFSFSFYILDGENSENLVKKTFYIDADRLINSIDHKFFYSSFKTFYEKERAKTLVFDDSYIDSVYTIDFSTYPVPIFICEDKLLPFDCGSEIYMFPRMEQIKIIDFATINNRNLVYIDINNYGKFWIDFFLIKELIKG